MKVCNRCHVAQELTAFHKNGKCGVHPACKGCKSAETKAKREANPQAFRELDRKKYERNLEAKKASIAAYYERNAEAIKARARERYADNAEQFKAQAAAYRAENKDKVYEWNGTRRAMLRQALPKWVCRAEIRAIYKRAHELTRLTGIAHHVDHKVPLSHPLVCGLHVPANLQVLTAAENMAKTNRF